MSGIQSFFEEARESKRMGPVAINAGLVVLFVIAVFVFSAFSGGFMTALAVIMTIAVIVSMIFFFASLAILFNWADLMEKE